MKVNPFANGVGGTGVLGDFPARSIFVHSEGILQNEALVFMIPRAYFGVNLGTQQAGNAVFTEVDTVGPSIVSPMK